MTTKSLALALMMFFSFAATCTAQPISGSDKWWNYIADYDGKPGSIRVDMALRYEAPLSSLPTLVIFGTKYDQKPETGFPTDKALDKLNEDSDSLVAAVLSAQVGIYVGTFTHDGEQLHYAYVRSADGTETAFRRALAESCSQCVAVYKFKADPNWDAYLKFLYPNEATLRHYGVDPRVFRTPR
jgi:hypothetical protein